MYTIIKKCYGLTIFFQTSKQPSRNLIISTTYTIPYLTLNKDRIVSSRLLVPCMECLIYAASSSIHKSHKDPHTAWVPQLVEYSCHPLHPDYKGLDYKEWHCPTHLW